MIGPSLKTERGNLGGLGSACDLSRLICMISSSGTLVNSELTSKEHLNSLLWLYVMVQSAKLKEFCKLVCGDWLKYTNKIRGKIVVIIVNRGNNWAKGASRFNMCNLGKNMEDIMSRTSQFC